MRVGREKKSGQDGKKYSQLADSDASRVQQFLERNKGFWPPAEYGSCNKCRTAFQAQVTKIDRPDFSLKDYVLAGPGFQADDMQGLLGANERLPNERCPADHALVVSEIWLKRSSNERSESKCERPTLRGRPSM